MSSKGLHYTYEVYTLHNQRLENFNEQRKNQKLTRFYL